MRGERADQATVRRSNLSLVLRRLRDGGPRSRAGLSAATGLNKATVSSLVAELVARGLVRDGAVLRHGGAGRPGLAVEVDPAGACGVGLEVNVDYLAAVALDLHGQPLVEQRVPLDVAATPVAGALDALAALARDTLRAATRRTRHVAGLTVAVPGLADVDAGVLAVGPNLGWRDVPVAAELAARLPDLPWPVRVDNDANLSALAEHALGAEAGIADLVYLTGEVGVGGGVIAGGRLLRGSEGFSGEVGHLPLDPEGRTCACGRRGCWETRVGLGALLRAAAADDDPVADPSLDLERRLAELERRALAGDRRTVAALAEVGRHLGAGAAVLVSLLNPRVLVLGGYFARLGPWLLDEARAELSRRLYAPDVTHCRIALSTLGFTAAVRGGALVAVESVVADPTRVPVSSSTTAASTAP